MYEKRYRNSRNLEIKDGHLYGALGGILNRAAPLMLAAPGITLVITTRGIDISVGAAVPLAGTVPAMLISTNMPMSLALPAAFAVALLCGL